MSIEEIDARLEAIRNLTWDDENAHAKEDALYIDFIEYVASLPIPIADKAKRVLDARKIEFQRWCA